MLLPLLLHLSLTQRVCPGESPGNLRCFPEPAGSQEPLLSPCSLCGNYRSSVTKFPGCLSPLTPWKSTFPGNSTAGKEGAKALTWNDSGLPWRGSDGDRDVHSGGFVQGGLDHPGHVLLVVSILRLLGHLLQVSAGQGVHRDTPRATSTATGLQLTLVLPRKKQDLFNMAQEGLREHIPDAAPRAGLVSSTEILCRTTSDSKIWDLFL